MIKVPQPKCEKFQVIFWEKFDLIVGLSVKI